MNAFFLEPHSWPQQNTDSLTLLDGTEAQHMLKVLRLKPGDEVWCTDGQGHSGTFRIIKADKHKAWLAPKHLHTSPRPSGGAILALGWAKSLRRGWLLEKAVEFEAAGLWIWQARHSQGKAPDNVKESWRSQCIAGAKQSKNPWLPELQLQPGGAAGLAARIPEFQRVFLLWEEPGCENLLTIDNLAPSASTLFIVGPEGGFAQEEVNCFRQAGALPISLGRRVLRWETAALLCLGLAWWTRQDAPLAAKDAP